MSQPGTRSRVVLALIWLVVGFALVGVAGWVGWTRWRPVLSGHPATLVAGIGALLFGFVAVAWSIGSLIVGDRLDREDAADGQPARRTEQQLHRRARARILLAVPALLLAVLLVSVLAYTRPFGATDVATAAMRSEAGVRVSDRLTWYEMAPAFRDAKGRDVKPTTGFVFTPGARVDPRAYAHVLRPLVAKGYLVVVLKEPFGISLLTDDHDQTVIDLHPEIKHWAVGGHSLGGVSAAAYAEAHPQVKGLIFFASYPASAMRRSDLKVLSLSGSEDGLSTPAKVEASKPNAPADTRYVQIPGAVHSWFGDYGDQPGDGTPNGDRAAAQATMATESVALLSSLTPPPAPKKKK
ncbi:MAG: Alpha/beta hydrolase family protein [Friedmanniella sp.]|nr:Alpha/beta hydrolase family protein [Friedmanniella sp.]